MTTATAAPATNWRQIDWSRHLHRTRVGDADLVYADIGAGDGPPIVFVHGLGGQWGNWLENLPAAATTRRAIALDLPGFGHSDMPAGEVSISGYARVIDELCEQLELGPIVAVGNSMGGFISAELAMTNPQRVDRLVLVGSAGMVPRRRELWTTVPLLRATGLLTARFAGSSRAMMARPRLRHAALRMAIHDPASIPTDLVWHGLLGDPPPAYAQALQAAVDYLSWDWCERLREVHCPTLVVWGERDAIVPARHGREFARLIPGAQSLFLPDTGHVPQVERPAQFNAALLDFVGVSGAGSEEELRAARTAAASA